MHRRKMPRRCFVDVARVLSRRMCLASPSTEITDFRFTPTTTPTKLTELRTFRRRRYSLSQRNGEPFSGCVHTTGQQLEENQMRPPLLAVALFACFSCTSGSPPQEDMSHVDMAHADLAPTDMSMILGESEICAFFGGGQVGTCAQGLSCCFDPCIPPPPDGMLCVDRNSICLRQTDGATGCF